MKPKSIDTKASCSGRRESRSERPGPLCRAALAAVLAVMLGAPEASARAQATDAEPHHSDVRAQTRLFRRGSTAVTQAQADDLTLTLTDVVPRLIQTWIRTAGTLDATGKVLTVTLRSPEADIVQVGQRLRAFSVTSRTQMYQGKVTRVTQQPGGALVEATLAAPVRYSGLSYLMEIVVERGPYLSVPNASIIEEGGAHVAYLQLAPGEYSPRRIETGLQGELYTEVVSGLNQGDQVVSIGSFFVDADNKLKAEDAE